MKALLQQLVDIVVWSILEDDVTKSLRAMVGIDFVLCRGRPHLKKASYKGLTARCTLLIPLLMISSVEMLQRSATFIYTNLAWRERMAARKLQALMQKFTLSLQ